MTEPTVHSPQTAEGRTSHGASTYSSLVHYYEPLIHHHQALCSKFFPKNDFFLSYAIKNSELYLKAVDTAHKHSSSGAKATRVKIIP